MLQAGIVGLPNVGKSTLFNAPTAQEAALAANYPFATIEPNGGVVPVPDERLEPLARIVKTTTIVPATVEFVDIAGLVRGASKGEGLGNQFLANIRETDAVIQVVRCFEDENVHHVEGSVNPRRDIETIQIELALADLSSVERRRERAQKTAKGGDKAARAEIEVIDKLLATLSEGKPARAGRRPRASYTRTSSAASYAPRSSVTTNSCAQAHTPPRASRGFYVSKAKTT